MQDLEVIGWTGKDLSQRIETIKSSGATAVVIRIQKTELHVIEAEMTAETSEMELYRELAKQGASSKDLRTVTKAAKEIKTAWALNRAMKMCPTLLDTMAGEYRRAVLKADANKEQREEFLEWVQNPEDERCREKLEKAIKRMTFLKDAEPAIFTAKGLTSDQRLSLLRAMDNADIISKSEQAYVQINFMCGC